MSGWVTAYLAVGGMFLTGVLWRDGPARADWWRDRSMRLLALAVVLFWPAILVALLFE